MLKDQAVAAIKTLAFSGIVTYVMRAIEHTIGLRVTVDDELTASIRASTPNRPTRHEIRDDEPARPRIRQHP